MSFTSKLRRALLEDDQGPVVPILSSEGIKAVFDVVRNYGLCLLVMLGALEFDRMTTASLWNQPPAATVLMAALLKWSLYAVCVLLFVGNAFFSTYVFERTPFYRARGAKIRWALFSVLFSLFLSAFVCLALYLNYQQRSNRTVNAGAQVHPLPSVALSLGAGYVQR